MEGVIKRVGFQLFFFAGIVSLESLRRVGTIERIGKIGRIRNLGNLGKDYH